MTTTMNGNNNDNDNIYLNINVQIILYKISHLYKLQNGLETIIKTKYFVTFIIATSRGFNSY